VQQPEEELDLDRLGLGRGNSHLDRLADQQAHARSEEIEATVVFECRAHDVPLVTGAGAAAATGVELPLVVGEDEATLELEEGTTRRMTTVLTTRRIGVV
jgi:hypothetical protein